MPEPSGDGAQLAAVRALAAAVNDHALEDLAIACATEVEFDTQSMLEPIFGRETVQAYMATLLATARTEGRPLHAVPATLEVEGRDALGALLRRSGVPTAFWTVTLDEEGKISEIFGYTRVPPPERARPLPEAAELPHAVAGKPPGPSSAFRRPVGPLRFHGFCVSEQVAESWLGPRLAALVRRFPGSDVHVHVHDPRRATPAAIAAQMRQSARFGVSGYPAICVERGGRVLRDGRAEQDLSSLIRDIEQLLDQNP